MQIPNNQRSTLNNGGSAVTASTSYKFQNNGFGSFVAFLNVTAHSGTTPTLDIKFQDSPDNTTFQDITSAAFTQTTTTNGMQRLAVSGPVGKYLKAVVTLGGTSPSYTFTLDAVGCVA